MRPALLLASTSLLLAAAETARPVDATLHDRTWSINGQASIPTGLFGVHAVSLTPELVDDLGIECTRTITTQPNGTTRVRGKDGTIPPVHQKLSLFIDCEGDRFQSPVQFLKSESGFRDAFRANGVRYGEIWQQLASQTHLRGVVQFYNEPYLNWAERSAGGFGSTINQDPYDLSQAVEGGPVTIKGWKQPLTHFRWQGLWPARYEEQVNKKTGKTERKLIIGWNVPIPANAKLGDTFTATETRYWRNKEPQLWTIEQHWYPVDPTVTGYWSGRQNLEFYRWMFGPFAESLRATNKDVTILAGWDFNYEAGDWSVWTELYRPLLQEFPQLIDGVTDHHYGLPPERVQGWYEVGTADAMAITGRFLKNWNTECQGRLDPAVHGNSGNAVGAEGAEAKLWEARYNLADIIGLSARMPDKAASRTVHNFAGGGFPACGAAWALRLLKPLRGQLLAVECPDQGVWLAAARRKDGTTVIACYNSRPDAVALALRASGSTGETARIVANEADGNLRIDRSALTPANGVWPLALASREGVVLTIADAPAPSGAVDERQVFLKEGALLRAGTDGAVAGAFQLTAEDLAGASSVRLRLTTDHLDQDLVVTVGTHELRFRRDLPVTDAEIPIAALSAGALPVRLQGPGGFLLCSASLILRR